MARSGGLDLILSLQEPSSWEKLCTTPLETLTKTLYNWRRSWATRTKPSPMKIVCVSDTHNRTPTLPDGDILVHAGYLSQSGAVTEIQAQLEWLKAQPHRHKIFIAGNYDVVFGSDREKAKLDWTGLTYLQDSSTVVLVRVRGRSFRVYGSPWTRKNGNWVFEYSKSQRFWDGNVPGETDILVTHMPPRWHLDFDDRGDESLLEELWRTRPNLHVFGHLHAGRGFDYIHDDDFEKAYERSRRAHGGFVALFLMLLYLLLAPLRRSAPQETRLVNASSLGGHREDLVRDALVVSI